MKKWPKNLSIQTSCSSTSRELHFIMALEIHILDDRLHSSACSHKISVHLPLRHSLISHTDFVLCYEIERKRNKRGEETLLSLSLSLSFSHTHTFFLSNSHSHSLLIFRCFSLSLHPDDSAAGPTSCGIFLRLHYAGLPREMAIVQKVSITVCAPSNIECSRDASFALSLFFFLSLSLSLSLSFSFSTSPPQNPLRWEPPKQTLINY